MAQIYRTVVGNDSPDITLTVKRSGTAIDVTGATVSLILKAERGNLTTNTGHQSCILTTPTSGIVRYTPQTTDFPREGRYIGDIKIVYSGGRLEWIYEYLLVIARAANS